LITMIENVIKSCLFVSLYFLVCIQTQEVPRLVFLKTAKPGDTVTLEENRTSLFWYKQSIGYVPQKVASIVSSYVTFFPPFDSSFNVNEPDIDLNIRSVSKEDEANYFCQKHYSNYWSGFFLSFHDDTLLIPGPKKDVVTVVLGILLACCLVVIIILLLTRNKKQVCEYCKGLYLLKI
uniref:Immunoglobulin V-set domain-containing protein n=1 Tax=Gadus morhua TaxID=8049 RepID=A0A8C5BWA7_GADMO